MRAGAPASPPPGTDPDSSEIVPRFAPRFRGDFMLNSQGDLEQTGTLFATGNQAGTVVVVDSRLFWPGTAFVAVTPCNANSAPATCPAPPKYPANYLGTLHPQGLVFMDSGN
jgi:hypothetical protein